MVTNLAYFFETSRRVRGGKFVWVKDSNGEQRGNVLLGGTILNPNKGFGKLYAAQLVQYDMQQGCLIFRSFAVNNATAAATDKIIYVKGDGYSDAPEVGMLLMKAPNAANGTGQSGKITAVEFDEANARFKVTLDTALGALAVDDVLVEAKGNAASNEAEVLVPKPNTFIEADEELLPTEGYGFQNANYSISTVYNKQAFIARMQPLPSYVLAMNRSYIDGIFWI